MQNIPTAIDSLNAQILLIQNEISSLKRNNKAISDSLNVLNETIEKTEIATTFYDTHLATYTTIFSVIVAIIAAGLAAYNIFGIYLPFRKKFEDINSKELPKLKSELEINLKNRISDINDKSEVILKQAINGHAWALKALQNHFYEKKNYTLSLFYALSELRIVANHVDINEQNIKRIERSVNFLMSLIRNHKITINSFSDSHEKFTQIGEDILASNKPRLLEFWYQFKLEFYKTNPNPTSSYDVDLEDPPVGEPSQTEEPPKAEPE